jgi:hypothetical protein
LVNHGVDKIRLEGDAFGSIDGSDLRYDGDYQIVDDVFL